MAAFRYKHGDRPLPGYTIQRAAGRGGFGEVYYALSDSGRELALKVVFACEQIELRGVSQCMNMKSPHLVTIFDVKHNEEAIPFVIMEFVSGPSLRQLLDESPSGLGTQKSAFFLREIAKGLTFLHECGIVHRDLKPGNIFYENGYVKIGDYGLSKAITTSQHSAQTITVGTVHYMAPEIGMGKYDRSIDIYALGAVLYEMLTGQVPYLGSSPAEILMKHISAEPDVSGIEEPFASVIRKSMAKDPAQRYQSVQEMVEAVFGAEHVRESVSVFSPDSLSVIAQRVAARVAVGVGASSKTPPPIPPQAEVEGGDMWQQVGRWADRAGERLTNLGGRMAAAAHRVAPGGGPGHAQAAAVSPQDPLSFWQRLMLAGVLVLILSVAVGVFTPFRGRDAEFFGGLLTLLATAAGVAGMLVSRRWLFPKLADESTVLERVAIGAPTSAAVLIVSLPFLAEGLPGAVLLGVFAPLFFMDWTGCMDPQRSQRVSFDHPFLAALFGMIVSFIFSGRPQLAIGVLAGISLSAQIMSPWHRFPRRGRSRKAPHDSTERAEEAGQTAAAPEALSDQQTWRRPEEAATWQPRHGRLHPGSRRLPSSVRYIWLALCCAAAPTGILLLIYPNVERVSNDEFAVFAAMGVGLLLFALLCFLKSFQKTFRGWWRYLVRPLVMFGCAQTILMAAILLGNARLGTEETMIAFAFIIFPAILLIIVPFLGTGGSQSTPAMPPPADAPAPVGSGEPPPPPPQPPLPADVAPADPIDWRALRASSRPPRLNGSPSLGLASLTEVTMAFIAMILLLGGTLMGIAAAVDMPGMIILNHPRPEQAPPAGLIRLTMGIGTWIIMLLSAGLLMMARRQLGGAHVLRGLLGVIAVGGSIGIIYAAFDAAGAQSVAYFQRTAVGMREASPPEVIEAYINRADTGVLVLAGIVMTLAVTLLAWPASRRARLANAVQEGAS